MLGRCASRSTGQEPTMANERNIQTQERMGEAINTGNLDVFDEIMSPTVVDHDPAPDQKPGPEGFKEFFTTMRTAFPDLEIEVDHLVADDDSVAFAYRVRGTHQGDFQGLAPTGRRIDARGLQISRFEDGRITERWGSSDEAGYLSKK